MIPANHPSPLESLLHAAVLATGIAAACEDLFTRFEDEEARALIRAFTRDGGAAPP